MTVSASRRTGARFAAALLLTSSLAAPAIAGTVTGTVTDATDTRSLQAAQLRIAELDRVAESDRDGSYRFADVPAGTYTIEARYIGAATVRQEVVVPDEGTVVADIALGTSDAGIIVIGQRANLSSSLSRQREADGTTSVLTRDAVGQFPDQNVAESLRRLPGINVLNDQGEGRFVSVRGLDPNLNSSSINGTRIPAPESDIRAVALDVISSDLIESIEVRKTLTPDMDADTIGASIEINTVSAFDRQEDLLTARIEGSYNRLSDDLSPKGSFDFSTRISDEFGISGGFSYYERFFETDNVEADSWTTGDNGNDYAQDLEYRDYDVERERISASLSADMRPSDTTTVYIRGVFSQFDDQEYRRRLIFDLGDFDAVSAVAGNQVQFSDADEEIAVERDIKDRFERQRVYSLTIGGETETGPWTFDWAGSWSRSSEFENGSIDPATFARDFDGDGFVVGFDYSDPQIPAYSVISGGALFNDPTEFELDEIELTALSDARDEEFMLRGNVAYRIPAGSGDFTIQAGAQARWREKRFDGNVEFYEDATGTFTLADVLGMSTYRLAAIDPVPSYGGARDYFTGNFGQFELQPIDSQFDSAVGDYRNNEDIYAGYLLGRWDSDTLRVIGGVRVERTENEISANRVELIEEGATFNGMVLDDDIVVVTPNNFERDYTDWLPSLNVRFEPIDNLVFRAAGYRSLVRPNLGDLAPRFAVEQNDDDEREGEFGNPDLLPYEAWNFDAGVEYYFASNGAISANLFYKDINNFIVDFFDDDGGTYNGIAYDEAVIPINGESADIFGIELSYSQAFTFLPSPLDGLLFQANYTYTDANGTVFDEDGNLRNIPLPASSQNTFNVVLGYEKGPISLRLAGTYRDIYLDELGGDAESDRYVDDHFQLDASVRFQATENIQLFWEWVNITDAPYFAYQNFGGQRRLLQYEEYDWTMKFGARVNF
ncbi:TonB-dependent receptor [uncultured Parasphingopyxis sp.]|uniref:TonB-dependent receptor n=1 Tax=uncultured Parasphingopyxis sp. TaxID=1547918 RepID=UPI002620CED7|nr:TonB-dependent receptor [uncultured Parasphingopyxis sp.]